MILELQDLSPNQQLTESQREQRTRIVCDRDGIEEARLRSKYLIPGVSSICDNRGEFGEDWKNRKGIGATEGRIVLSSEFCSFLFLSSTLSSLKYYSLSFKKKKSTTPYYIVVTATRAQHTALGTA